MTKLSKLSKLYVATHCRSRGIALLGILLGVISVLIILSWGIWNDRSLDYAVSEYKGYPVDVSFGLSLLFILTGPISVAFNITMEIIRAT